MARGGFVPHDHSAQELGGGTFTVSKPRGCRNPQIQPRFINPPQVAIMPWGRLEKNPSRPVAAEDARSAGRARLLDVDARLGPPQSSTAPEGGFDFPGSVCAEAAANRTGRAGRLSSEAASGAPSRRRGGSTQVQALKRGEVVADEHNVAPVARSASAGEVGASVVRLGRRRRAGVKQVRSTAAWASRGVDHGRRWTERATVGTHVDACPVTPALPAGRRRSC